MLLPVTRLTGGTPLHGGSGAGSPCQLFGGKKEAAVNFFGGKESRRPTT